MTWVDAEHIEVTGDIDVLAITLREGSNQRIDVDVDPQKHRIHSGGGYIFCSPQN